MAARVITLWALIAGALGAPTAELPDYRSHVDQARFFLRRGWLDDALAELERATAHPDGALDGQAWYLLAEVRYRAGDVEGALRAAERAHSHSDTPAELELAAGFSAWLRENFGWVEVGTRFDGVRSAVTVELDSLLLDPELKTWLAELGERLARPHTLPARFGLPAGQYRINGRAVAVAAGERTVARIPVRGAPPEPLQVTELEVSGGLAMSTAPGVVPGPQLRAGISQPLGVFVVGAAVDWTLQPHQRPDGVYLAAGEIGGSVRAGVEAARIRDAALRAELSARVGRMGAWGLPCGRADVGYACGAGAPGPLWVYPGARVIGPGIELSAVAVDRRRRTALGWGVRLIGELGFGRRAGAGDGRMGDDAYTYTVAEADQRFVVGGLRVLGTVVWAR